MQRTKNRLDEEQKRKKDEALKRAFLGGDSSAESSASDVKRSKNEQSDSDLTTPPEVIFEQRYEVLEDLCFGRISFG
ncbi:unnamed protein product, partial [Anisakis simplex]|uniref:IBB domain-containing protein n=1 Tax=Anisakis simplex TaxID=6269 RepID=A0A0M3JJB5_ANISI